MEYIVESQIRLRMLIKLFVIIFLKSIVCKYASA